MDAPYSNRLRRALAPLRTLPNWLRTPLTNVLIGRAIPFVATAGLRFERLAEQEVVVRLANRRRVRNHIGSVHAAAMALLVETASGLVVGMNIDDAAVPVLKRMSLDYTRRAQGELKASANLDASAIARLRSEARGELLVPVQLSDADGATPLVCEMLWAWTPRRA